MQIRIDTEKPNYILTRGDYAVSGVFHIYKNAKKEYDKRIKFAETHKVPEDVKFGPFRLKELALMEKVLEEQVEE